MSDIPEDVRAAAAKANMDARVQSTLDAQTEVIARAIMAERARAAKACETTRDQFLSVEYTYNQPLGSMRERFACDECAAAIRKGEA